DKSIILLIFSMVMFANLSGSDRKRNSVSVGSFTPFSTAIFFLGRTPAEIFVDNGVKSDICNFPGSELGTYSQVLSLLSFIKFPLLSFTVSCPNDHPEISTTANNNFFIIFGLCAKVYLEVKSTKFFHY